VLLPKLDGDVLRAVDSDLRIVAYAAPPGSDAVGKPKSRLSTLSLKVIE